MHYATQKQSRLHMLVPQPLIERVDNWRFENRIDGRSEAIRRLVEIGLEAVSMKAL